MNETKPKPKWEKWAKRFFIGACCFIIVAVVISFLWSPPRPDPEIMKLEARETCKSGTDLFVVILDVSIKNYGEKGNIKVIAEVDVYLEGYYGKQDKTIFLDKGETTDLQFVFETNIVVKETLIFGEPIYPHYTYGIELEY